MPEKLRLTCPVCRQHWPEGKDPAAGSGALYQMRLADFVSGLNSGSESLAMLALVFQHPIRDSGSFDIVAARSGDISAALNVLDSACLSMSTTPAIQSIKEFIADNANDRREDGLDVIPAFNSGRYKAWVTDGVVRFEEVNNGD